MTTLPFQPVPGTASLVVSASNDDSDIRQHSLAFTKNDGTAWGSSELEDLVDQFNTWLALDTGGEAAIWGSMSSAFTLDNLYARDLSADGGPTYGLTISQAGNDDGVQLASGISFAITLRTGLSGRSFRGRLFKFGITKSFQPDGGIDTVDETAAGDVVTGWNTLITAAAGWSPAMKWVVISRYHKVGDVPNVRRDAGVTTPITVCGYSNLVLDYQRRRAPFHARHN